MQASLLRNFGRLNQAIIKLVLFVYLCVTLYAHIYLVLFSEVFKIYNFAPICHSDSKLAVYIYRVIHKSVKHVRKLADATVE